MSLKSHSRPFRASGVAFVLLACAASAATADDTRPLEEALKKQSADLAKAAPAEALKVFEDGIKDVAASGVVEKAPKVGEKVELFELPGADGKLVKLADLLARGPVVLTWYRGGWCPFCNTALRGYVTAEPAIRAQGATLVAITPETPDNAAKTIKADDLTFQVLSDKNNAVARKYKLVYKLPEKTSATMKAFKVDLEKFNGDTSDELPLGATFVIDTDRTVRWAFVDADYRKRAEPADIIAALNKLKK